MDRPKQRMIIKEIGLFKLIIDEECFLRTCFEGRFVNNPIEAVALLGMFLNECKGYLEFFSKIDYTDIDFIRRKLLRKIYYLIRDFLHKKTTMNRVIKRFEKCINITLNS